MTRTKYALVSSSYSQQGVVLLDALVAIVIFSIGILGMVSLQGAAIKLSGDAKYRSDAAMLADQVISEMWTDKDATSPATLATLYTGGSGTGTDGTKYTIWADTVDCASSTKATGCLPGVKANPPTIAFTTLASTSAGTSLDTLVTVTVKWQAPNDTVAHNYVSVTQIGP
jgi:type IV pilus assembly protein PilV